eukprot:scaffold14865_cov114-Skeletonema_dohrnii-CCMP3373.AAC.5
MAPFAVHWYYLDRGNLLCLHPVGRYGADEQVFTVLLLDKPFYSRCCIASSRPNDRAPGAPNFLAPPDSRSRSSERSRNNALTCIVA